MSDLRDFGIDVAESDDGVRYQLPFRPLGRYRLLRLVLMLFGVLIATTPPIFLLVFGPGAARQGLTPTEYAIFSFLFVIIHLMAGLVLIAFVLAVMFGRTRIEMTTTQLISFEEVGDWRLTTSRRPLQQLQRFKVARMWASRNGKPITEGPLANLAFLSAGFLSAKSLPMAPGYPGSWLRLIAEDIVRRRLQSATVIDPEAEPSKVQVVDEVGQGPDPEDYTEQPADSPVIVERQPDSVVLKVPPMGLHRSLKSLFYFALFWGGFLLICPGLTWMVSGKILLVLVPMVIFWTAFIASLLAAINMRLRRAVLAVVGDTLMVYQTGLFGAKRREWRRDEVASIRVGPSGMGVNEVPVLELQVHSKNGTKVGLLAGRNVDELRWLATTLRSALHTPPAE
jgi:hypothetical protein